jgi:hypothetical protein
MLTVKFNGQTCCFDSEGVDFDRPGIIDACLIRGEFYEQRFLRYIASLEIRGAYVDVGAFEMAVVFNASPTYEFVPSFALWTRMVQCSKRLALQSLRRILPRRVRELIRRAAVPRGAARRAVAGTGPCADRRSQGRAADR